MPASCTRRHPILRAGLLPCRRDPSWRVSFGIWSVAAGSAGRWSRARLLPRSQPRSSRGASHTCLAEAANRPLHTRHNSVILRAFSEGVSLQAGGACSIIWIASSSSGRQKNMPAPNAGSSGRASSLTDNPSVSSLSNSRLARLANCVGGLLELKMSIHSSQHLQAS